jgi:1-aminocyclopropane-1-carboxylate synthase
MTLGSLSQRGARAAGTPLRVDYDAFREAMENRYDPARNPTGALPLNVAENRLSWHELKPKLESIAGSTTIPDWVAGYTSPLGAPEFREHAARFLTEHLTTCEVDPAHLGVSAGATGVIEMTALILADAGDVAAIPAPCYPVYRQDLGNVAGVERYDIVTHRELSEIASGPALGLAHLDRARREIEASGRRFRLLVLTSPDNPTGGVYPVEHLAAVADWCIDRSIHLVVNEIYGLSLLDTSHPEIAGDYEEPVAFTSFANVMAEKKSDFLHQWYAVSKDLGISGFRVGLVHSHNPDFLQAYENLNLTHSVSNHTQWLIGELFRDTDFLSAYVARNRTRLTESYALVARSLKELDIPYVPSRGSLFAWVDLSEFLTDESDESEMVLWRRLFDEAGILLTPGVGFGHGRPGLFRIVYPSVSRAELEVAMKRLAGFVQRARD